MTETTEIVLTDDEWNQVVKRLALYASTLVPGDSIKGLGIGRGDLVNETLRRLWDPATGVKWRSSEGPPTVKTVVAFLKVVLKNYFLDCLRSGAYTHTAPSPAVDVGPESEQSEGDPPGSGSGETDHLVERILVEQLYTRARALAEEGDDVDVALYLDLQVRDGGPYPNAEAAKALGVAAPDIVNIRKRLDRLVIRAKRGDGSGAVRPRG